MSKGVRKRTTIANLTERSERRIPCQHSVLFVEDKNGRRRNEQKSARHGSAMHDYCEFDRAKRDQLARCA